MRPVCEVCCLLSNLLGLQIVSLIIGQRDVELPRLNWIFSYAATNITWHASYAFDYARAQGSDSTLWPVAQRNLTLIQLQVLLVS